MRHASTAERKKAGDLAAHRLWRYGALFTTSRT
jgi:hypothetical protein